MSRLVKTDGIVLRLVPFQDYDLILTVFTEVLGKVGVFVKGARRPKSRFGPEIDLLSRSEFVLFDAKNTKPLREATLTAYYPNLKADYDHLHSALLGARLLSHLVHEGQRDGANLRLFFSFLDVLDRKDAQIELYELAFKLRVLDNFGTGPHLKSCIRCHKPAAPGYFSLERGGMVCVACHAHSDTPVRPTVSQSLLALREMEWNKLERLKLQTQDATAGNRLLDRFMAYHIKDFNAKGGGAP